MTEQEAIKELNVYVSDEHKLTLPRECIDLARKALEKQISLESILERMEDDIADNPDASLGNYRAGLYKAIEIVKEEGGIE